jgi:uncharacterized damage-inducible protein DinB
MTPMSEKPVLTALDQGPATSFSELAGRYLQEYLDKILYALDRLDEDDLWWRPAPGTNSVGNLMLHLAGNLSLWILQGVGGQPFERDRAAEFTADGNQPHHTRADVIEKLTKVVAACQGLLIGIPESDLARVREIQGYKIDGQSALFHAVEHMAYHTGQILWAVKMKVREAGGSEAFELYPQHAGE